MDLALLVDEEKRREQMEEDRRMVKKVERQIAIFNKDKSTYTHRKVAEITYQRQILELLDEEKAVELDNYLATQSATIEKLYAKEQKVVEELVQTSDTIDRLTRDEVTATTETKKELNRIKDRIWEIKKEGVAKNAKLIYRTLPDESKMNGRCEWANGKFHIQLCKNKEIQKKIDLAVLQRNQYIRQEKSLNKEIEKLNKMLRNRINDIAEIHERRDQTKGTKMKVREHLTKMKEQCERELLGLSLALCDDKKMDAFMRTKHRDNTKLLRERREQSAKEASSMTQQKDEFSTMFDKIKNELGKPSIGEIVYDFQEEEEENFSILLNIGDILQDNEITRTKIRKVRSKNIAMEEVMLGDSSSKAIKSTELKAKIAVMKKKSAEALTRIQANDQTLGQFQTVVHQLIETLNIPRVTLKTFIDKDGVIKGRNLLGCMAAVESEIGLLLRDYYLVELMHRAASTRKFPTVEEEVEMVRKPSTRIAPFTPARVNFVPVLREKEELDEAKTAYPIPHEEMKDMVVKTLLDKTKDEDHHVKHKKVKSRLSYKSFRNVPKNVH